MGSVSVATTRSVTTASAVLLFTMTGRGRRPMASLGPPRSVRSASVMATLRAVTWTGGCGWRRVGEVAACVITVSTTLGGATVRSARGATTEIQLYQKLHRIPVNRVCATLWARSLREVLRVTLAAGSAPVNLEWPALIVTDA